MLSAYTTLCTCSTQYVRAMRFTDWTTESPVKCSERQTESHDSADMPTGRSLTLELTVCEWGSALCTLAWAASLLRNTSMLLRSLAMRMSQMSLTRVRISSAFTTLSAPLHHNHQSNQQPTILANKQPINLPHVNIPKSIAYFITSSAIADGLHDALSIEILTAQLF